MYKAWVTLYDFYFVSRLYGFLGFGVFILKQLLAENTQNLSNKVNEEINTA